MNTDSSTTGVAAPAIVEAREYFGGQAPREWVPLLAGYGVRLVDLDETVQPGDFQLSCSAGRRALYAIIWDQTRPVAEFSSGVFRYTRHDLAGRERGFTYPVFADDIAAAVKAQVDALAAAERQRLGEAVARYREAMELGTTGVALRSFADACDEALAAFKFEMRGGWWDARTGTWGIGALEDEDRDFADAGGVILGPHS